MDWSRRRPRTRATPDDQGRTLALQERRDAPQPEVGMSIPQRQLEPPFPVLMAGNVVDFHNRATCLQCSDDGCPRLSVAGETLRAWRDRKSRREGR